MSTDKFNEYLEKLIELIVEMQAGRSFIKATPPMKNLEKYKRVMSKLDSDDLLPDFVSLYREHKKLILKSLNSISDGSDGSDVKVDDNWLVNNKVVLSLGQSMGKNTEAKIAISLFYKTCLDVKDAKIKQLEEQDVSTEVWARTKELKYPSKYLLYLYNIFATFFTGDKKELLDKNIAIIEASLGNDEIKDVSNMNFGETKSFDDILKLTSSLGKMMGIPISADGMNTNTIKTMLNEKIGDNTGSEIIDSLDNMLSNKDGAQKNPMELFGKLFSKFMPQIQGLMSGMQQQGIEDDTVEAPSE